MSISDIKQTSSGNHLAAYNLYNKVCILVSTPSRALTLFTNPLPSK